MTREAHRFWLLVLVVGSVLGGPGGCGSTPPSRFYVLGAVVPEESARDDRAASEGADDPALVGVGLVQIPKYLDQPQIVTRAGPHRLERAEFDRWAEPLADNIARVLAENLEALLDNTQTGVVSAASRAVGLDYEVWVGVTRFDVDESGKASLAASWGILKSESREPLLRRASSHDETVEGETYEAKVSALSRTLASLSQEVAAALQEIVRR